MRLEPLAAHNRSAVRAFLDGRPYETVFIAWLISIGAFDRGGAERCIVARDLGGGIGGVFYDGPSIVLASHDSSAIDAFAAIESGPLFGRTVVGPNASVARYWSRVRRRRTTSPTQHLHQPLYAVDSTNLQSVDVGVGIERAGLDELDEIAREAAEMISLELGYDPPLRGADVRERVRRQIELGWWWRSRGPDGELRFQCHIGAVSERTAQLQGVWTPPGKRGRRYATRALTAICARLLTDHPTLSLYVNDFNLPAIALYERIGFRRVGELATILFR